MTRERLAIFFAAALAVLYSYEVVTAILNNASINGLHVLGLVCALGLLIIELRQMRKADGR
jgi:hypothetical protein